MKCSKNLIWLDADLLRDHPVVTRHKIDVVSQGFFWPFPGALSRQIGFGKAFAIDKHFTAVESNALPGHPDDAFNDNLFVAMHAKTNNITALWFLPDIRQFIDKAVLPIAEGGIHAVAGQLHRHENEFKHQETA